MMSLLIEALKVDIVIKFQIFTVFDVNITGNENGEISQYAFCTNPFLWNLRVDEVWIYDSDTKDLRPT